MSLKIVTHLLAVVVGAAVCWAVLALTMPCPAPDKPDARQVELQRRLKEAWDARREADLCDARRIEFVELRDTVAERDPAEARRRFPHTQYEELWHKSREARKKADQKRDEYESLLRGD